MYTPYQYILLFYLPKSPALFKFLFLWGTFLRKQKKKITTEALNYSINYNFYNYIEVFFNKFPIKSLKITLKTFIYPPLFCKKFPAIRTKSSLQGIQGFQGITLLRKENVGEKATLAPFVPLVASLISATWG